MKNKSETDFSMRRNKDKKQKANIKNHSIYVPFLKKSLTLAREYRKIILSYIYDYLLTEAWKDG